MRRTTEREDLGRHIGRPKCVNAEHSFMPMLYRPKGTRNVVVRSI